MTQQEPTVGMAATIRMWADSDAATVVEVLRFKSGPRAGQVKGVVVQKDIATSIGGDGTVKAQEYTYAPNPEAPRLVFHLNNLGRYRGRSGDALGLGTRRTYREPSF
jgi:hypothetical protein